MDHNLQNLFCCNVYLAPISLPVIYYTSFFFAGFSQNASSTDLFFKISGFLFLLWLLFIELTFEDSIQLSLNLNQIGVGYEPFQLIGVLTTCIVFCHTVDSLSPPCLMVFLHYLYPCYFILPLLNFHSIKINKNILFNMCIN